MRLLVLLLIAGCGVSEATAPKPSVSLETWLARWKQARECMVYPAEDLRTGVAITLLLGRDCASDITGLAESATGVPTWDAAISLAADLPHSRRPAERASLISAIDRQVETLGVATPRATGAELPLLPGKKMADVAGADATSGGVLRFRYSYFDVITRSLSPDARVTVRPHTLRGVPTMPRGEWLMDDVTAAKDLEPIGVIDDGRHRLIVGRRNGDDVAYRYLSSSDVGATWLSGHAAAGTRLVRSTQDPITGALDLVVRDLDRVYLHHIVAGTPPTISVVAWENWTLPRQTQPTFDVRIDCQRDGVFWSLKDPGRVRGLRLDGTSFAWALKGSTDHAVIDCKGQRALVLRRNPDVLELCADGCVPVFTSRSDVRGDAVFRKDGSWIYAAALEDVVVVSRPGKRVEFFRISSMHELGELRSIVDLDDSLTMVMEHGIAWFRDDFK